MLFFQEAHLSKICALEQSSSLLQDALLHPQLPVLAFLMAAAAKGYTLGQTLGTACLRIIHDLAVVPLQDMTSKGAAIFLET